MNLLAFAVLAALSLGITVERGLAAPVSGPPALPPGAPTLPLAKIDDSLDINGEGVKARQIQTRMFVQVQVNGKGPFRFFVDSGADRSVIGSVLARQLALPAEQPLILQGMAGASRVETVRMDRIRIGASEINDIVAPTLPEEYLGAQGLLGIDALEDQRLMLDFQRKMIVVQDARKPAPAYDGEIVVTARRRNGQLILTEASVMNNRVYVVIDTGTQMSVGNSALLARVFRGGTPPPSQPITMISVTGQPVAARMIVLPEISIGGMVLRQVPVAFADVPPFRLFGLTDHPSLLLGSDLLEAFGRVSLDFRRRKVRFLPRR